MPWLPDAPLHARVSGAEHVDVRDGWELLSTAPGACASPGELPGDGWIAAQVPGTVAGALRAAGEPAGPAIDERDWWFRTRVAIEPARDGEELVLALDGLATACEVHLGGALLLESPSMFQRSSVPVPARLAGEVELAICCRALAPRLRERRRPRARWRTKLVDGGLRFHRTMLLGRAPGFAPAPPAIGPWRPVRLERRRAVAVDGLRVRAALDGDDGRLTVDARLRVLGEGSAPVDAAVLLDGPSGSQRAALSVEAGDDGTLRVHGALAVPRPERWWPHTHGAPALHDVRLELSGPAGTVEVVAGRVGFRSMHFAPAADDAAAAPDAAPDEASADGLTVNGVRVFVRGAVWTPLDLAGMAPDRSELRRTLERVAEAGMNMLRIPGTAAYEEPAFHDLCDELGILVWQDFMFANLDYPVADADFRALVAREAAQVAGDLAQRPSLAVFCGNSEIEQQVAMLGLEPGLGRGELFGELLPDAIAASGADAAYVPSAPSGGALPFRPGRGVANYYGVGGYRRPLEDARRAQVRFAAECLALANVPDDEALEALLPERPGDVVVHHPAWKAGVPRDAGTGWDFDDVRDHYLGLLHGVEPGELRRYDHDRYLELSRTVSGEVMAAVLGEWRRVASSCGGGLVLWLRDLVPGAGWGLLDHRGEPKVAYHHLRRASRPAAVWLTDEGLDGIAVHVANDGPEPLRATLRVSTYRDLEHLVEEVVEEVELPAHGARTFDLEALLGRFIDAAWAYRFGPPAHDLVAATLTPTGEALGSPAVLFPAGRPQRVESPSALGLEAELAGAPGAPALRLRSRRLAWGVRIAVPGHRPEDDALCVEPGREVLVALRPDGTASGPPAGEVTALNLRGRVVAVSPAGAAPERSAAPVAVSGEDAA